MARLWLVLWLFLIAAPRASPDDVAPLPNTQPLTWQDELDVRLMDGAHRFVEQKIDESLRNRATYWNREPSSREAYEKSVEPNRQGFMKSIGVVDPRLPVVMERFGDEEAPALAAETGKYSVWQVRWPVLERVSRVTGEGLLLIPKSPPRAHVVALPDADQTPEQLTGLAPGIKAESQFARRLAENGFQVLIPVLLDRTDRWSGGTAGRKTDQPHREWIYRQAFQMGRHILGFEVQKVLAAVDWFKHTAGKDAKVAVAGYGEGGLIAFYAAAVDQRIDAALISGYFNSRQSVWSEPIYRNVWGLLREFGDAELATLIAPRPLVIEYSPPPVIVGPKGSLRPLNSETVRAEFSRIDTLIPADFQTKHLVFGDNDMTVGPGSQRALELFSQLLGVDSAMLLSGDLPADRRRSFDPGPRQRRQVLELENFVQWMVVDSDNVRAEFFLNKVSEKPIHEFVKTAQEYKRIFWEEVLGKLDDPLLPPNPRSRKIYDRPRWVGYDVVLDVFPDVIAWGVLLLPKDLKPGERRPVVVCQHGRQGLPENVIEGDHRAYHDYAAKLADRGFIVFAPHNLYRGEDRYRWLDRKANTVKASMFSVILAQHEQILNWLQTLPQVDPERIGFYGLSYGGETAVRVPPLLERYALSICSADFNDWTRKIATTHGERYSFMFTIEWEMPYFNMGNTFSYAELAYLMAPRPFMVERGHRDGVAPDEWVAYEYAKVRRMYTQLGIGDRTEIEFFDGPHTIHGQGTFEFLHKHLRWPARRSP